MDKKKPEQQVEIPYDQMLKEVREAFTKKVQEDHDLDRESAEMLIELFEKEELGQSLEEFTTSHQTKDSNAKH